MFHASGAPDKYCRRPPSESDVLKYLSRAGWPFVHLMSTTSETSPLRKQRLVALALCWAWYTISGSIGLNALIKFVPYPAFVRSPLCNLT
jgi:hypothetical protein